MIILEKGEENRNPAGKSMGKMMLEEYGLQLNLEENITMMQLILKDDDTVRLRMLHMTNHTRCCLFFLDGMVNNDLINQNIIKPLLANTGGAEQNSLLEVTRLQILSSNDVKQSSDLNEIISAVLYGDTILFIDGYQEALIIGSKGWQSRSIVEPDNEKVLRGPREGFTEAIMTNISLLRRKLLTNDLKFKFQSFGTRTNTKACICYLDSLVDKKVLEELYSRLEKIVMDGTLDSNYILEQIKDAPMSPFKTIGITERPDVVAAKLLEGRVAFILDGSPVVLTLPYLLIENFQSNDDYYLNFYFASLGRMLRIIGFFLTISVPAIYLAFTTYHWELLPSQLALSIAKAHQGVPFPTIVECLAMLFIFEIIRETGMRTPSNIGQALSIVGALVVGQSAVEAKFISAPIVIIVALTAITGLINPKATGAAIVVRLAFLLASSMLGFYGYFFACIGLLIHLLAIQSFGVNYTEQMMGARFQNIKDSMIRAPWGKMITRPLFTTRNTIRNKKSGDDTE